MFTKHSMEPFFSFISSSLLDILKYSLDCREGHMKKIKCVCLSVALWRVKGQRSKKHGREDRNEN